VRGRLRLPRGALPDGGRADHRPRLPLPWCQRESGTAFALNAVVERAQVTLLQGEVEVVSVPSESGKGQRIVRCPQCRIALWSHYPGGGDEIAFVRVGALDHPDLAPPDLHIYTASKQPWLELPHGARAFAEFYDPNGRPSRCSAIARRSRRRNGVERFHVARVRAAGPHPGALGSRGRQPRVRCAYPGYGFRSR